MELPKKIPMKGIELDQLSLEQEKNLNQAIKNGEIVNNVFSAGKTYSWHSQPIEYKNTHMLFDLEYDKGIFLPKEIRAKLTVIPNDKSAFEDRGYSLHLRGTLEIMLRQAKENDEKVGISFVNSFHLFGKNSYYTIAAYKDFQRQSPEYKLTDAKSLFKNIAGGPQFLLGEFLKRTEYVPRREDIRYGGNDKMPYRTTKTLCKLLA